MSKFIMVLLTVMCLMPTMAFSFSESDHERLLKKSYEYKQADEQLNKNWDMIRKELKGTKLFKIALAEQRQWLNSRSERIDAIVKKGASLAAAATIVTEQQASKLLEFASHGTWYTGKNEKMSIEDRLALLEFAAQWSGKYTYGEPNGEPFEIEGMTRYPEYGQAIISFEGSSIYIEIETSSSRASTCGFQGDCSVIDNVLVCKAYNENGPIFLTAYVRNGDNGNKILDVVEAPGLGWCGNGARLYGIYTKRQ